MTKWTIVAVSVAALLCGAAWAVERSISAINGMVTSAADTARAERDAHWQAEIAKSNAEVANARAEQAEHAAEVEDAAQDKIALAERQLTELRKDSDALPDDADSCGLSAAGVELLNR